MDWIEKAIRLFNTGHFPCHPHLNTCSAAGLHMFTQTIDWQHPAIQYPASRQGNNLPVGGWNKDHPLSRPVPLAHQGNNERHPFNIVGRNNPT